MSEIVERLRDADDRGVAPPQNWTTQAADLIEAQAQRIAQLEAERDELKRICRDAYEVWAGSEGIPRPETAAEAYLLSLLEQMLDEVKRGLKEKP